jgi:hypothetical protein
LRAGYSPAAIPARHNEAIATAADPIKMAVAFYIGLPLDLFQRLAVSPGSITALMISPESSFLLNLNYDLSFNLPKG